MKTPQNDHQLFMSHFLSELTLLKSYLLAATRDPNDADDLLQEVSSVLWKKFQGWDANPSFRAWALGIARLEVLKWRQRHAHSRELLSEEILSALVDTAIECGDEVDNRRAHLRGCLKQLPPSMATAVRLKYQDALTIVRIAEHMSKNVGAVEMLLVRARRALRECIERKLEHEKTELA